MVIIIMIAHHLYHDYLEFFIVMIIIVMITSTGREESAQLCVYVGGEKVVTGLDHHISFSGHLNHLECHDKK